MNTKISTKLFSMMLMLSSMSIQAFSSGCTKAETEVKKDTDSIPATKGTLTNLGPQIAEKSVNGSTFLTQSSGKKWLYSIETGSPSRLLGYDPVTGKLITNILIPGVTGSWRLTSSTDGILYIATNQGVLCKHVPGSDKVENLGKPIASETYMWDVSAGKNGEVFGATYPGCRVFRYHPAEGFSDVGKGPIVEGENYAHNLVYHAETDKIYVGTATANIGLVELNPRTGEKKNIMPAAYQGLSGFVYYMGLAKGNDGDRLLVTFNKTKIPARTLVYNLKTQQFEKEMGPFPSGSAIRSSVNHKLYYTTGAAMWSYDLSHADAKPQKIEVGNMTMNALAGSWINNDELQFLLQGGRLLNYNINSGSSNVKQLEVPPMPIHLHLTALGADGKVWTSGYPIGGNGAFDPKTNKSEIHPGLSQAESMGFMGKDTYFGLYGGRIWKFNTEAAWSVSGGNPKMLGKIEGQDRPFANVSLPTLNKIYFGTVPDYGRQGGALVEYDNSTQKMTSFQNLIPEQSIVSLTSFNNQLIGGTSIWGGLGTKASTTEAKLFGWNPETKTRTFEIVPVKDAKAITALIYGPDKNIWGMADGTLFIYNPLTGKVIFSQELFAVSTEKKSQFVWANATLLNHKNGKVYGVAYGELFELNATTKSKTAISKSASRSLVADQDGNLYFHQGINLWKYTL
jgi:hypothetical protein